VFLDLQVAEKAVKIDQVLKINRKVALMVALILKEDDDDTEEKEREPRDITTMLSEEELDEEGVCLVFK
jgi:hypothetical protein